VEGTIIPGRVRNTALLVPQYGMGNKEIQFFIFNVYDISLLFPHPSADLTENTS
jgi:hypothetical protein